MSANPNNPVDRGWSMYRPLPPGIEDMSIHNKASVRFRPPGSDLDGGGDRLVVPEESSPGQGYYLSIGDMVAQGYVAVDGRLTSEGIGLLSDTGSRDAELKLTNLIKDIQNAKNHGRLLGEVLVSYREGRKKPVFRVGVLQNPGLHENTLNSLVSAVDARGDTFRCVDTGANTAKQGLIRKIADKLRRPRIASRLVYSLSETLRSPRLEKNIEVAGCVEESRIMLPDVRVEPVVKEASGNDNYSYYRAFNNPSLRPNKATRDSAAVKLGSEEIITKYRSNTFWEALRVDLSSIGINIDPADANVAAVLGNVVDTFKGSGVIISRPMFRFLEERRELGRALDVFVWDVKNKSRNMGRSSPEYTARESLEALDEMLIEKWRNFIGDLRVMMETLPVGWRGDDGAMDEEGTTRPGKPLATEPSTSTAGEIDFGQLSEDLLSRLSSAIGGILLVKSGQSRVLQQIHQLMIGLSSVDPTVANKEESDKLNNLIGALNDLKGRMTKWTPRENDGNETFIRAGYELFSIEYATKDFPGGFKFPGVDDLLGSGDDILVQL